MAKKSFTKADIIKLKGKGRPYKVYGFGRGLHLYVSPSGGKLWRLDVRYQGRALLLSLGAFPDVGMDEAIAAREIAKSEIRAGRDPRGIKAEPTPFQVVDGESFGEFADAHIRRMVQAGRAPATVDKAKWLLGYSAEDDTPAIPGLAKTLRPRAVGSISPQDVLKVLRPLEAAGKRETARRLKIAIGMVYRLAIIEGAAERDPTAPLKGALLAPETEHVAAIIEPRKFGGLLRAIDAYDGSPMVRAALQLAALTALRPGELRHAKWDHISFKDDTWTIPRENQKRRMVHKIPLARQAVEILEALHESSDDSEYLFPSPRAPKRPMSDNAMNAALKTMGFDHTAHGFRSSFSTLANESGKWSRDAIERQLSHADADQVRAAYHRGPHWEERTRLVQWWADHCDLLRQKARRRTLAEMLG